MAAALDGGTQVISFMLNFAVFGASGSTHNFPQWWGNGMYCYLARHRPARYLVYVAWQVTDVDCPPCAQTSTCPPTDAPRLRTRTACLYQRSSLLHTRTVELYRNSLALLPRALSPVQRTNTHDHNGSFGFFARATRCLDAADENREFEARRLRASRSCRHDTADCLEQR